MNLKNFFHPDEQELHLIQYSATGVMFYSAYQNGEEQFSISTLVGVSEVRIRTEKEQFYCVRDYSKDHVTGQRKILDENSHEVAGITRMVDRSYIIKVSKQEIVIRSEEDGYIGYCGGKKVLTMQKVDNLQEWNKLYHRPGYDMTYAYKITISPKVSESMKVWIGAFPMLRM